MWLKIQGHAMTDGTWSVRAYVSASSQPKYFDGGSLIACLRAMERSLMDEAMGTDDDFEPDLHDLTGETKHIGVPLNKDKDQ